jgi:hypothetical protein
MGSTQLPGGRFGLPRWMFLALVPFALLAVSAVYLQIRWNDIPLRFPVHWGAHGADRWETRTFLGVYSPIVFAAGLAAVMLIAGIMGYVWSNRSKAGDTMLRIMVGMGCFLALIFCGVALMPLGLPPAMLIAAVPFGSLIVLGILLVTAGGNDKADGPNGPYPALFVPKTIGWGYDFNFANRRSWIIVATLFGGIAGMVAFLLWAQR